MHILLAALSITASATPIMVTSFEALDPAARALADGLPDALSEALEARLDVHVVAPPDGDTISGSPWDVYLASCPPGQAVGCAYVVGRRAGAAWALTGTAATVDGESLLRVDFVHLDRTEPFRVYHTLERGEDAWEAFADDVALELLARIGTDGQRFDHRGAGRAWAERPEDALAQSLDDEFEESLEEIAQLQRERARPGSRTDRDRRGDVVIELAAGGAYGITAAEPGAVDATQDGGAGTAGVGAGVGLSQRLDLVLRGRAASGEAARSKGPGLAR